MLTHILYGIWTQIFDIFAVKLYFCFQDYPIDLILVLSCQQGNSPQDFFILPLCTSQKTCIILCIPF